MKLDQLETIRISESERRSRGIPAAVIFAGVALILAVAAYFAWPRASDARRIVDTASNAKTSAPSRTQAPAVVASSPAPAASPSPASVDGVVLTTSGYIINRERIELSPRFVGIVKWMGVRKGDPVQRDQIVVLLDDELQKARVAEAEGRLARATAALNIARIRYGRRAQLRERRVESIEDEDTARAEVESAAAIVREASGQLAAARTELSWTVIRSPIDGVVLEKLADENELVSPQSYGGDRGPSTALLAVADSNDLQVEIDVNESELARIHRNQRCNVYPEAYPERRYDGYVAEIAPEANRQKGTLQVKVQIANPDSYLVPELSARVDFVGSAAR